MTKKFKEGNMKGNVKMNQNSSRPKPPPTPTKQEEIQKVDWNELSRLGLIRRINEEILHPLGFAIYRIVETGVSPGALVSPDGKWEYPND